MKAIILAAGQSTRLKPLTLNCPKSLLDLGESNLIEYQIGALRAEGISDIVVVTGFLAEQFDYLREKENIKLIHNPRYKDTNNLYTFWCARDEILKDESVCLYADLIFHPGILRECVKAPGDISLVVDRKTDPETMQVRMEENRVKAVSKAIPRGESSGTFLGMARLSSRGAEILMREIENIVKRDEEKEGYFTVAIERLIKKGIRIGYTSTGVHPWVEVDTLEDLERLRNEVYPAICGKRL